MTHSYRTFVRSGVSTEPGQAHRRHGREGLDAHDSEPLDARLREEFGIETIAPHRPDRKRARTQDGRAPRRYMRRWKIERLFVWLLDDRRLTNRWERHPTNFLGFVQLGCICILLRQF
jgi:transposase